jgi:predicted RNA polymerase sigma factor
VALMEIQTSRARARVSALGEPILLLDQNRALWDRLLIGRGLAALQRAERLTPLKGPYRLQAEIAACHARAVTAEETDWARIVSLYGELATVMPSPVVELNRAVAVGFAEGPEAALKLLEPLQNEPLMKNYHLLPSVRGDMLARLGRHAEAAAEFERAAGMTQNAREQNLLRERSRKSREAAERVDA